MGKSKSRIFRKGINDQVYQNDIRETAITEAAKVFEIKQHQKQEIYHNVRA